MRTFKAFWWRSLLVLTLAAVALPPEKSLSSTDTLVTLQRDPPLTRILAPGFLALSRRTTERLGLKRRAKIAVARPAAPAPTMATSQN